MVVPVNPHDSRLASRSTSVSTRFHPRSIIHDSGSTRPKLWSCERNSKDVPHRTLSPTQRIDVGYLEVVHMPDHCALLPVDDFVGDTSVIFVESESELLGEEFHQVVPE